jgi:hypothetical protein
VQNTSEQAFSSSWALGLHFAASASQLRCSPRCRNTSIRDVAVWQGRRGSPFPRRRNALERVRPSVQSSNHRSVSLWSKTPEMQRDFAGEIGRRGLLRRPRRNAKGSVFPSSRAVGMPIGSAVRLGAEALRFAASPTGDTVEAAVTPHRGATFERFRRRAIGPPSGSVVIRHIARGGFASSTAGWSSGKPLKPGCPAASGSEVPGAPKRSRSDSAVREAIRGCLVHDAEAPRSGRFRQARPSSHLPLRTVTSAI